MKTNPGASQSKNVEDRRAENVEDRRAENPMKDIGRGISKALQKEKALRSDTLREPTPVGLQKNNSKTPFDPVANLDIKGSLSTFSRKKIKDPAQQKGFIKHTVKDNLK